MDLDIRVYAGTVVDARICSPRKGRTPESLRATTERPLPPDADPTPEGGGTPLAAGQLEGPSVICSCHGSQFDLHDGTVINGPATMPEPHSDVRVDNGKIKVKQAL